MPLAQSGERRIEFRTSPRAVHYALELVSPEGKNERVGYLALERLQAGTVLTLEATYQFFDDGLTIRQVETFSPEKRELVWRESGAHALRGWIATQDRDCQSLEFLRFGTGNVERSVQHCTRQVLFPLESVEALRQAESQEYFARLSPLLGDPEEILLQPLELELRLLPWVWREYLLSGQAVAPRAYRFLRSDGSAAEAMLFDGDELISLELQPGGICARRLPAHQEPEWLVESSSEAAAQDRFQILREWVHQHH